MHTVLYETFILNKYIVQSQELILWKFLWKCNQNTWFDCQLFRRDEPQNYNLKFGIPKYKKFVIQYWKKIVAVAELTNQHLFKSIILNSICWMNPLLIFLVISQIWNLKCSLINIWKSLSTTLNRNIYLSILKSKHVFICNFFMGNFFYFV